MIEDGGIKMIEVRFHWHNPETEEEGTLRVSATTLKDCIEIGQDEIESAGLLITDYYQI